MAESRSKAEGILARFLDAPSRLVTAAALAILLGIVASFSHGQWQSYQHALEHADRSTRNVTHLLAEHAARTFDGIDATLRAVGRLRGDVARGIYRSQDSIYVHLKTLHGGSPVLAEVGWFDAYGQRVATSEQLDPARISVGDQEFFRVHRDTPDSAMHVSAPTQLPDGSWRINFSRRLENLDGSFAGVVAGTVDPAQFVSVYRGLELGPGHAVTLLRRDGIVLARSPDGGRFIGRTLAEGTQYREHLSPGASGTNHADAGGDVASIGSYAVVPRTGDQLLVDVSVSRRHALANFHQAMTTDLVETGFGLAVLLLGARLLVLQLRRREVLQVELSRATAAATAARAEAEAANRAKSEFLARMSHELRTPLNAVIGFAQMLEIDPSSNLSARQKEYGHYIQRGGEHLLKLVNEVLDLAGVEAGRMSLSIERIVVAEALDGVHEIMRPVADKAGVTLAVSASTELPDVRADTLRLRQVLINLVANAIKYNRPAGAVTVSATATPDGRLRFVIRDTGYGIPGERHADLFEPFQRGGAEFTAVEGTGLGLALAKRLVEAMDGTIGFSSEPGHGSTFWIELPIETAVATPVAAAEAPRNLQPTPSGGYTVLYVEDNPANLRLMEHLLATLPGVSLLAAPTPQLGLELALTHRPDVIVLDLNLPGMSGYEVLAQLKAMPETSATPVLALSAAALPSDMKRGSAAGFLHYLTKPVDARVLFSALEAAIALNRVQDAPVRMAPTLSPRTPSIRSARAPR